LSSLPGGLVLEPAPQKEFWSNSQSSKGLLSERELRVRHRRPWLLFPWGFWSKLNRTRGLQDSSR
jgi:hypothetical protein